MDTADLYSNSQRNVNAVNKRRSYNLFQVSLLSAFKGTLEQHKPRTLSKNIIDYAQLIVDRIFILINILFYNKNTDNSPAVDLVFLILICALYLYVLYIYIYIHICKNICNCSQTILRY